jgi:hypothetical protein
MKPQSPELRAAQAARRINAATRRLNKARQAGSWETVEALRAVLLSAVKVAESPQPTLDEVVAYVLVKLPEMYGITEGGS